MIFLFLFFKCSLWKTAPGGIRKKHREKHWELHSGSKAADGQGKDRQKTAIILLNTHKYSRKLLAASIPPQVRTSPDLNLTKENDNTPIRGESFRHKQLTVKCLGTGPFSCTG